MSRRTACHPSRTTQRFSAVAMTFGRLGWLAIVVFLVLLAPPSAVADPGTTLVRLPVTRDTRVSTYSGEEAANLGGSSRLRFKSYQEFVLVDWDVAPLKGRVIRQATLYLRSEGERPLDRVTVGSISADWVEGTNDRGYTPQDGASSFLWRKHPDVSWAGPGTDLCAVILGAGGSVWRMSDAFPPDKDRWQRVAVDPQVIAARVAGLSGGFVVFDDTGSEWKREGEKYEHFLLPPRVASSREDRIDRRPYLLVQLGEADETPPGALLELRASAPTASDVDSVAMWVEWNEAVDVGPAGVIGYHVLVDGEKLPLYRQVLCSGIETDAASPRTRRLALQLADWSDRDSLTLTVRPVDAVGNLGPAAELKVARPPSRPRVQIAQSATQENRAEVGNADVKPMASLNWRGRPVRLLHLLDKIDLRTGQRVGAVDSKAAKGADARSSSTGENDPTAADDLRALDLFAARNEWLGFQVLFSAPYSGMTPRLILEGAGPQIQIEASRLVGVRVGDRLIPDPAVPARSKLELLTRREIDEGTRWGASLVEWLVPGDFPAGRRKGKLVFAEGNERLEIPVTLTVWPFSLPNTLSFVPEMNCYGLPATATHDEELDWYRMAHRHRTCLNRLPYHHNGSVTPGCAPAWNGREFDWRKWDARFGPLFDGSAFAGSPRGEVPVEAFYLPLFENWPTAIEPHFNGDYWADRALSDEYRRQFVEASRAIAEHLHRQRWEGTQFQFYLNGKNEYKRNGWSRSTSPWTLDEPANFQDFFALRWFGEAFHEGIRQTKGPARIGYRVDISRPQWQRESLDGLVDYNVVNGEIRRYPRIVMERARRNGEWLMEYGAANPVDASNTQPAAWCVDGWLLGLHGVLPWQTIGHAGSWDEGDPLALLYPANAKHASGPGPIPSLRLKAFRYGEQLVEYLAIWEREKNASRAEVRTAVLEAAPLAGKREGTGFVGGEDAGRVAFGGLMPWGLEKLRRQLGQELGQDQRSPLQPPLFRPRARQVPLPSLMVAGGESPIWMSHLHERMGTLSSNAGTTPKVQSEAANRGKTSSRPVPMTSSGKGDRYVDRLQGKPQVRDALIDPEQADVQRGAEPKDNALRRTERGNAFLLRFELDRFRGRQSKLSRAILRVRVWDPSSMASTRLDVVAVERNWDEQSVTWRMATANERWPQGEFLLSTNMAPAVTKTVVAKTVAPPDQGSDIADPPIVLEWDVTKLVSEWLAGKRENYGLAIMPVVDRTIDGGHFTRLQVYGSETGEVRVGPELELHW